MDIRMESIYDTYAEPNDEVGYTHIAAISNYHRNCDDLQPTSLNVNYLSVIAAKKCRIKLWITFITVTISACALAAGLTYIVIQSRYNTKLYIPSKVSISNENENTGVRISEIPTKCPNDWKILGSWCYKEFSEQRTWFQAHDYCRSIGTDLVSVHNERESKFLNDSFTQTFKWIGLNNFQNNGRYVWSDGTILNYTDWGPSEPNNINNNENCAQSYHRKWNDNNCFMSFRFICKMQINPRCGPGDWVYFKNFCYLIGMSLANFTGARDLCKNNDADLVIIRSKEEYNFVLSQTSKQSGDDFWIGLKKLRNQTYKWIDGSNPTYLPFRHEPDAYIDYNYDFCIISSSLQGTWADNYCISLNRFICEKQLL
ncbi:MRC [Mytilus coruscus]|uniref:MRC n=1 Tax=Mytilus coruscus TaxID=42192 RepID=A0A6J8BQ60_MYTCO|nr:MRC [Mytilus coruscus]